MILALRAIIILPDKLFEKEFRVIENLETIGDDKTGNRKQEEKS
jgi:hypothetical protein